MSDELNNLNGMNKENQTSEENTDQTSVNSDSADISGAQNTTASDTDASGSTQNTADGAQDTDHVDGSYGFSYRNGSYKYNDDYVGGSGSNSSASGHSSYDDSVDRTGYTYGRQNDNTSSGSYGSGSGSSGYGSGSSSYGSNRTNASGSGYGYQSDNNYSNSSSNGYGTGSNNTSGSGNDSRYRWQQAEARSKAEKQARKAMRKQKLHRAGGNGKGGFGKTLGKAAAIAAVFGLVAGLVFSGTTTIYNRTTGKNTTAPTTVSSSNNGTIKSTTTSTSSSGTTVTDVSGIVSEVMPSIVQVTNVSLEQYNSFFGQGQMYESTSAGSGIIVSQDDNYIYIATNNHVVSNSNQLTVTFSDNESVSAEIVGTNEEHDIAVIRVAMKDLKDSTKSTIKVATLGDSDNLTVGESAIVIGNALGYGQSVTTGVISATNRQVSIQDDNGNTITNNLIQTDAAVNPGNSGGALLNLKGEVVGIVSAKYSDTKVEGMGYAIPITKAKEIINALMKDGTYSDSDSDDSSSQNAQGSTGIAKGTAYLGIYGMDINSSTASQYNMPEGVYVSQVVDDSAADKAGLEKGDVITAVDGTDVTSMNEVKNYISSKKPGDEVKITYADAGHNYREDTVTATLGEAQ